MRRRGTIRRARWSRFRRSRSMPTRDKAPLRLTIARTRAADAVSDAGATGLATRPRHGRNRTARADVSDRAGRHVLRHGACSPDSGKSAPKGRPTAVGPAPTPDE